MRAHGSSKEPPTRVDWPSSSATHRGLFEGLVQQTVERIDVAPDGCPVVTWKPAWVLLFGTEQVPMGASLERPRTVAGAHEAKRSTRSLGTPPFELPGECAGRGVL
jgi:hypothetical protein